MSLQVQGTNDSSIVSKFSMVDRGYFDDDYIHCFVVKPTRRSPIINIGYYVRAAVISSVLKDFVKNVAPSGTVQIVSFGAGFDTSYFQLCDLGDRSNFIFYEIDLLNVVKRKKKLILDSSELSRKLVNVRACTGDELKSSNYNLMVCDLSDIPKTEKCLIDSGFNRELPTLFLAECSITYMDEGSSTNLINWSGDFVKDGTFVTYEQINPYDGFGMKMTKHFTLLQSPLLSLSKYPTIAAQKKRYKVNGWSECAVISAWTALSRIASSEEILSKLNLEPFDEWEEWHLKCNHYSLSIARNGIMNHWRPYILNSNCEDSVNGYHDLHTIKWTLIGYSSIQRYAHTSVIFGKKKKYVLTIGGFGIFKDGFHKRLKQIICSQYPFDVDKETQTELAADSIASADCMHHTCTVLSERTGVNSEELSLVLFGGRTSPMKCTNTNPLLLNCLIRENGEIEINCRELIKNKQVCDGPAPRWRHSACLIEADSNKWYIVFGGCSTEVKVFDDLWILNVDENVEDKKWICEPSNIKPKARFSHSAAVWKDNSMIVSCGVDENTKVLCDIWIWNFKNKSWKDVNMSGVMPRYGHSSFVFGNTLLLVGGVTTACELTPGVAVVDLVDRSCREYRLPILDPSTSIMLHNHSTIFDNENKALVSIGGGGNCFSFGTHLNSHLVQIPLQQFGIFN